MITTLTEMDRIIKNQIKGILGDKKWRRITQTGGAFHLQTTIRGETEVDLILPYDKSNIPNGEDWLIITGLEGRYGNTPHWHPGFVEGKPRPGFSHHRKAHNY